MKYLFGGLSLFFISIGVFSQSSVQMDMEQLRQKKRESEFQNQNQMRKSKLNFYLNNWEAGITYTSEKEVLTGKLYRYNIYTDQIEVREVVEPNKIEIISIGSKKFVHTDYIKNGVNDNGYFELLVDGDCRLLIKRSIKFEQGSRSIEAYGTDDSFKISSQYFFQKGDEPATVLKKGKRHLLDAFSDKDVSEYLKDELGLIIREQDLVNAFRYYNNI